MRLAWARVALMAVLVIACAPSRAPSAPATPAAPAAPAGRAGAAASTAAPATPDAQAVESFYRGKTIRFVTAFSAGGLFDNYTRGRALSR